MYHIATMLLHHHKASANLLQWNRAQCLDSFHVFYNSPPNSTQIQTFFYAVLEAKDHPKSTDLIMEHLINSLLPFQYFYVLQYQDLFLFLFSLILIQNFPQDLTQSHHKRQNKMKI